MSATTISLQRVDSLEPDRQVKEIVIGLNILGGLKKYTTIRIGEDTSSSVDNPPVKVEIRYPENTKFDSLTEWIGEQKDSPKIWLGHENGFLKIICSYDKSHGLKQYLEDRIYMINTNEVAYVDVKY